MCHLSHSSRFHYDLTRPEEPWHLTCTVGQRRRRKAGAHLRQGFHVYGTDNSLAEGFHGYRQIPEENEQNPTKPASSTSGSSSGPPREVPAATFDDHQSRHARTALLRATSMKAILPPEGMPVSDEIRPFLTQEDTEEFDDLRRVLGEDGPDIRRLYAWFTPPFRVHKPASRQKMGRNQY